MNTKIEYLYRDASNYKIGQYAIVSGTLTHDEIADIYDACDNGMYFIPWQVGLDGERFSEENDDDHPWFELLYDTFHETNEAVTTSLTADELYQNFMAVNGNWADNDIFY